MPEQSPEAFPAAEIANELSRCRQRGLDDLDASMPNQPPVTAPELEQLATTYVTAEGREVYGRAAQIRILIRDGLTAYTQRGNQAESQFVSSLFFDVSDADPPRDPSTLLAEARAASGLDERRFADYRRSAFRRFAAFLVTFVAQSTDEATQPEPAAPTPTRKYSPWLWAGVGVAVLVIVGGVLSGVLLTNNPSGQHHNAGKSPPGTHTPSSTAGPSIAGKTYAEMTGQFGSPTFTDPHNPSVTGKHIEPYSKVQVSCKVLAPTIPSVSPDGYWYRIASSPWDNKYYGVANTFLNGDKIGGPSLHNTDFKVPDCPG